MSRLPKLLDRLKSKPKDFTYEELRSLLGLFGCAEESSGRTSGSRVAFVHHTTGAVLRLHKPHPGNELKAYQLDIVLAFLESMGVK